MLDCRCAWLSTIKQSGDEEHVTRDCLDLPAATFAQAIGLSGSTF